MRTDGNPIKLNPNLSAYKVHRIIMPVYIPNEERYYRDAFKIFTLSVNSLINTISLERTNITIINNASIGKVDEFIRGLQENNLIDQYIYNTVNRGKADAIIGAAKASYEPLITITDADVLFLPGWFGELEKGYYDNPRAGNICPFPAIHLKYYSNSSTWVGNIFKIRKGNVIKSETLNWFAHTVSRDAMYDDIDFKRQFYIKRNGNIYLIGAGHFVAMYRREVFDNLPNKASLHGLKGGLGVIENQVDKLGFYKLSLTENMVLHMGNIFEPWMEDNLAFDMGLPAHYSQHIKLENMGLTSFLPYFIINLIGKCLYLVYLISRKVRTGQHFKQF